MIDTIIQTVRDTVYIKGADALDILNKTNDFYDSAWNKLIIGATTICIVAGGFIPLLVNWYQQRIIKMEGDKLIKEMQDKMNVSLNEYSSLLIPTLNKKMRLIEDRAIGFNFHNEGLIYRQTKYYNNAFFPLLQAINSFIMCEYYDNVENSIINIEILTNHITKSGIDKAISSASPVPIKVNEFMNELYAICDDKHKNLILRLITWYTNLKP